MPVLLPVESPSVWMPNEFPDDAMWSFELSDQDRQALVDYGRGGPSADLGHQFGAAATRWSALLNEGPGFLRLRGFPVDSVSDHELERAYIGLGKLFGEPVRQDRDDNLITHIRDERTQAVVGRRYQTNLHQDFHSDSSDLVGLLCLRPAKRGGKSKIVSAHAVYNEMLRRDRHLVEVMYTPMPWSRNAERRPGVSPYFELAPITDIAGVPRIFFIAWYIRQSQAHAEAPRLTNDQQAALVLMESIANDPAFQIEMEFQPGDVQLLNNTTMLHAREAYVDHADPRLRRHLLRLWLSIETPLANGASLPTTNTTVR